MKKCQLQDSMVTRSLPGTKESSPMYKKYIYIQGTAEIKLTQDVKCITTIKN